MKCFNFFSKRKTLKLITGQVKIFEAGKALVIGAGNKFNSITIQSHHTNDGIIYIGNIDVNSSNGMPIERGDTISLDAGEDYLPTIYATSNISSSIIHYFGIGEQNGNNTD